MTGRYVLQFPRGIVISIFPNDTNQFKQSEFWENFRARIKKAFAEYTEETNPDYIVQDKLEFIDEGVSMYKRGWHHWSGDNHVDKIASVLVADAIKTVLEYSEIEVDNR